MHNMYLCTAFLPVLISRALGLPATINLGGAFDQSDPLAAATFALSVASMRGKAAGGGGAVPGSVGTTWVSVIERLGESADPLHAFDIGCRLLSSGSLAVFTASATGASACGEIASVCSVKRVPHFAIGDGQEQYGNRRAAGGGGQDVPPNGYTLAPPMGSMGMALADVLQYYQWHSFVLIYDTAQALGRLESVLHMSTTHGEPSKLRDGGVRAHVTLLQMPLAQGHNGEVGDMRPLLKGIMHDLKQTRVLLHASTAAVDSFMRHAAEFAMTAANYHYVIANWDAYTVDLEQYKQSGCNVTTVRLVDIGSPPAAAFDQLLRENTDDISDDRFALPTVGMPTSLSLIHDSVSVLAHSLRLLHARIAAQCSGMGGEEGHSSTTELCRSVASGEYFAPQVLSCDEADDNETLSFGPQLHDILTSTAFDGVTGPIRLGADGSRVDYEVHVLELGKTGYNELGRWRPSTGLNVTQRYEKRLQQAIETLENRTLRVTVILEAPFVMLRRVPASGVPLVGNDRFDGFCIDLLREIARIRRFNYTIHVVKDRMYGSRGADGTWNGMVGELMRGEADLAVASLTVSYSRSEVIDFTTSYMHLGISILFKRAVPADPGLLFFMAPLSPEVWIYMLAAYVGVSLALWILARFSPYEWYDPHPCAAAATGCSASADVYAPSSNGSSSSSGRSNELEYANEFTLANSFWYTVGSLMQQGGEVQPRSLSVRVMTGAWWGFVLIMISSYTANMAAFLTVERMGTPVESADDLAKQTTISYGTLSSGSTHTFFKESKIATYKQMWSFMESAQPSVLVNTSNEGITRVKKGGYAYLMESLMLEYYVERDCELMQVGGMLDSKGYGIGLPKHSSFREPISQAILKLQEKAITIGLKDKWWRDERYGGGKCRGEQAANGANSGGDNFAVQNALGLKNVGGRRVRRAGGRPAGRPPGEHVRVRLGHIQAGGGGAPAHLQHAAGRAAAGAGLPTADQAGQAHVAAARQGHTGAVWKRWGGG